MPKWTNVPETSEKNPDVQGHIISDTGHQIFHINDTFVLKHPQHGEKNVMSKHATLEDAVKHAMERKTPKVVYKNFAFK